MTNQGPLRRPGWVALLTVTGVVLGGAYAVHRHRRKQSSPSPKTVETPCPQPALEPAAVDPGLPPVSRPLVRPPFILALILVLAIAAVTAIYLSEPGSTALPNRRPQTESPTTRPVDVDPLPPMTPLRTEHLIPAEEPAPSATVVPDSLRADDMSCTPEAGRPVLDTVRPVLAARLTMPAPIEIELEKENTTDFVPFNRGDLAPTEDGYVTLYLRRDFRLDRGDSYRWRIRIAETGEWSPWCEFAIAATTLDSLNIEDISRTVDLPPSKWRTISAVLDDPPRFWSIFEAARRESADDLPIEMPTRDWETVIELLAERASAINDPKLWRLVDTLSVKLDGPPHPTLGFPRT